MRAGDGAAILMDGKADMVYLREENEGIPSGEESVRYLDCRAGLVYGFDVKMDQLAPFQWVSVFYVNCTSVELLIFFNSQKPK